MNPGVANSSQIEFAEPATHIGLQPYFAMSRNLLFLRREQLG